MLEHESWDQRSAYLCLPLACNLGILVDDQVCDFRKKKHAPVVFNWNSLLSNLPLYNVLILDVLKQICQLIIVAYVEVYFSDLLYM